MASRGRGGQGAQTSAEPQSGKPFDSSSSMASSPAADRRRLWRRSRSKASSSSMRSGKRLRARRPAWPPNEVERTFARSSSRAWRPWRQAADDAAEYARLNTVFHGAIRRATGNRYLERFLEQVESAVRRLGASTYETPGRTTEATEEHRRIATAIAEGDIEGAEAASLDHMRRARELRIASLLGGLERPATHSRPLSGAGQAANSSVEMIAPPGGSHGDGLHWFRVEIDETQGRCFITDRGSTTTSPADHGWAKRALEELGRRRGWQWLKSAAASSSGLMLHCSDAREPLSPTPHHRIRSKQ